MIARSPRRSFCALMLVAGLAGWAVGPGTAQATTAATPAAAAPALVGPVSTVPAAWTPYLASPNSRVKQLVQCGGTMFAVGSFTSIKNPAGATFARSNAFSFSAVTGAVSAWDPRVNGTVNSIAVTPDCRTAFLGGVFTSVRGAAAKNIAAVSTSSGTLFPAFSANANGQVNTLHLYGAHLLTGGYFTSINGSARGYLASLSPATGRDDGYLNLSISGSYQYPGVAPNPTRVYNMEPSHNGKRLLVMGVFTSAGGRHREQIFMLDLPSGSVTGWTSAEFNKRCSPEQPFYVQSAAWSPSDTVVYVASTGNRPATPPLPFGDLFRSGLCDAAAAMPAIDTSVVPLWVNYTGCDSLFSIAADLTHVYVGGHQRFANNQFGCDEAGPGSVPMSGIGGLLSAVGLASPVWNPGRSRGYGASDMTLTSGGLWIASDNFFDANLCAGKHHPGICFFPY